MKWSVVTVVLLVCVSNADFVKWNNQNKDLPAEDMTYLCGICTLATDAVHYLLLNDTTVREDVLGLIAEVCAFVENRDVCNDLVALYSGVVFEVVGDKYLTPEFICWKLHVCPAPGYVQVNVTLLIEDILADAPPVQPLPTPGNETLKFLHITDMHLDSLYAAGSLAECGVPMCCREEFGNTTDPLLQAGYWGSLAVCDLPYRTIEATLQQIAELDVDFILWTGDNPAHDLWLYTQETHLQESQALTDLFLKYFPDTAMFPIQGNHASYPDDQYHWGHEQWLTQGLADMWASWLTPDAQGTLAENAYYSIKDNQTGLRILAINTMVCDNVNFWNILNDTDPGGHLQWLRQELYQAEANGEYVFIIGHIPIGDIFCESTWAEVYRAIVNRFRNIIRGQFFGHTHQDQFQIVKSLTGEDTPAGVIYILPSLSTWTSQNPAFRIFELDQSTLQIVNFETYRLDLVAANQDIVNPPRFSVAYDAKSEYDLVDLSPASWQGLATALEQGNQTLMARYWLNFYSSTTGTPDTCDGK